MTKFDQKYHTEDQIAKLFGLSARTLQKMRAAGNGSKFHKLGGSVRYHLKDVEEWAEQQRRTSTGETENKLYYFDYSVYGEGDTLGSISPTAKIRVKHWTSQKSGGPYISPDLISDNEIDSHVDYLIEELELIRVCAKKAHRDASKRDGVGGVS